MFTSEHHGPSKRHHEFTPTLLLLLPLPQEQSVLVLDCATPSAYILEERRHRQPIWTQPIKWRQAVVDQQPKRGMSKK